jgi:hypothetical protein
VTTTYGSAASLARPLPRAAEAHGRHEERTGRPDLDWPDWLDPDRPDRYAGYVVREQAGEELPR